jgi:hypothetical protein
VPGAVVISTAAVVISARDVPEVCCEVDSDDAEDPADWLLVVLPPAEVLTATLFKSDVLNWPHPEETVKKITIKTSSRLNLMTFLNIITFTISDNKKFIIFPR